MPRTASTFTLRPPARPRLAYLVLQPASHCASVPSLPPWQVPETGYVDEAGELRRPWCPATRILEHREQVGG